MMIDKPSLIKEWSIGVTELTNPYQPPECCDRAVSGRVYGDPRFLDGEWITTSSIASMELVDGEILITTKNSRYILSGEAYTEYDYAYPNARDRLIAAIQGEVKRL